MDLASISNFFVNVFNNPSNYFLNTTGLYSFLSLIGLIILYLVRPKPRQKTIPSLMFFLKDQQKNKLNSLFKYFVRNLLFFLQLLILIILSTAIAAPYITQKADIETEHTALVIDVSASTQTKMGFGTRFDKIISEAKKKIGKRNTIILISDTPQLLAKDEGKKKTLEIINTIKPKDTGSNIGDAILFAGEQLEKGKIVVISDFISTGTDPYSVKKLVESKGIIVEFVDVSNEARNIGIIDLIVNEDKSVLYIKNFNDKPENVNIKINNIEKEITINAKSVETHHFVTPQATTEIIITVKDDFSLDNKVYISAPQKKKNSAIMITNNPETNLYHALTSSSKLDLEISTPPIVKNINHDIIILQNVNVKLLLKETINEIKKKVQEGSLLIIAVQDDLFDMDLKELLPVTSSGKGTTTKIILELNNKYTKDIIFGSTDSYFKTTPKQGAVIASANDNSSLIVYTEFGKGKILYYGIDDAHSVFKNTPWYPIFWDNMIKFMLGREDITKLNFKTGTYIGPDLYDKTGLYDLPTKKIAVNLLNEKESNINRQAEQNEQVRKAELEKATLRGTKDFIEEIIFIALIFLFLEFLYIKMRGDV